jgi:arsenate reductase
MFSKLSETISNLDRLSIPKHRLEKLQDLSDLLSFELEANKHLRLNFICTHNSRRSHLAQVWAHTLAQHFNLPVDCYSGGTEATAVYPMVLQTLKSQGFQIEELVRIKNSVFSLKYEKNARPLVLFSKRFDHQFNPKDNFIAIMTCSDADENCPLVSGAKSRFALTYEDPKAFDDSEMQEEKYRERSLQIATELFEVFQQLSKRISNV